MSEWIDIQKDEAHVKREREKARELRASAWWKAQCAPGICHYCGKFVGAENLTMDHIVPVARGGTSTKGNVVPVCHACNASKSCLTRAEQILDTLPSSEESAPSAEPERERPILITAEPHGFCTGVARAISIARKSLQEAAGEPVYCLHEIVHNQQVVSDLAAAGMKFVQSIEEVPAGAHLLFSAHGVSPAVRAAAAARQARVIDATCPFVEKVHRAVRDYAAQGMTIVCIGHAGHDEVVGIAGEAPEAVQIVETSEAAARLVFPADQPVAVVTQTTFSVTQAESVLAVLQKRRADLVMPKGCDVCYATRDRQQAVRAIAKTCGFVIVLGSPNSSNSRRLVETAQEAGATALLISTLDELKSIDLSGHPMIGITSGASTPESLMNAAIDWIRLAS